MIRLFVRHEVRDYDSWRTVYDEYRATRLSLGVIGDGVFRNVADGNEVTLYLDFETLEAAQSFVNSDEMRGSMERAGVTGEAQPWFTEEA